VQSEESRRQNAGLTYRIGYKAGVVRVREQWIPEQGSGQSVSTMAAFAEQTIGYRFGAGAMPGSVKRPRSLHLLNYHV
jgi:hypothetical protein